MKRQCQSIPLLAVLVIFIGCGGGGSGDAVQSQAPGVSISLKAPWFDPANNILLNGGFEDRDSDGELPDGEVVYRPYHWDRNIYFLLPPNWEQSGPGVGAVRADSGHLGVDAYEGGWMALISSGGLNPASLSQDLPDLASYPSPQIFNISFWYNMYAYYDGEGHPTFVAKLQAWLYEYEDDPLTGNYIHLFEAAYKDKDKEWGSWADGGSIRGWKHFSTSRKLDGNKNYVLFFQVLTDWMYDVRITGFIDDVMVIPIPSPPGLSGGE